MNKSTALILFAKVLDKNIAKTRVAKSVGKKEAAEIYEELLCIAASQTKEIPLFISYTGDKKPNRLTKIFPKAISFFPQCEGNLGERMRSAFNTVFDLGYSSVIAIGGDCPTLKNSDLKNAAEFLQDDKTVVVGPAVDGGYYLIGCRKDTISVLDTEQWSTANLYKEVVGIIQAKKYKFLSLEEKDDIDEIEDYRKYKRSVEGN